MPKKKPVKKIVKPAPTRTTKKAKAKPHTFWEHLKQMLFVITPFIISAGILSSYLAVNSPQSVLGIATTSARFVPCIRIDPNKPSPEHTTTTTTENKLIKYPCATLTPKLTVTPTITQQPKTARMQINIVDTNGQFTSMPKEAYMKILKGIGQESKLLTTLVSPSQGWAGNILVGAYTIVGFSNKYTFTYATCSGCQTAAGLHFYTPHTIKTSGYAFYPWIRDNKETDVFVKVAQK